MQALRVHDFTEGLRLDTLPDPVPGPGEVRVRVQACGVPFFEMLISRGGYQWRPTLPFVVGSEFAGVVDALGDGAQGAFAVGDRVWGFTSIGAWTQRLCVPGDAIHAMAARASIEEAAVLAMPYGTSLYDPRKCGPSTFANGSQVGEAPDPCSVLPVPRAIDAPITTTAPPH